MKNVVKVNNAMWLNTAFILWLICEIMFSYSVISRLMLILFVGLSFAITHKIYLNYAPIWYGIFILWSAVNIWTGHAADKELAYEMTQTTLLNLGFLFALVSYCRYIGDIRKVLGIYKWVVFAFCIPCFIGGLGTVFSGERLTILQINANTIAMLAAYASVVFINDFLDKPREKRGIGELAIIAFLLITILLTGSRKGLIIPMVGFFVLVCFRKPGKFVINAVLIAVAAVVVLYLILNVSVLYNLIGHRVESVIQYLRGESFDEASMDSRLDYIQLAWEQSAKSPIWGHGLDCFRLLPRAYGTYSHCNYAELLYSLGWPGVVIYYIPYVYALLCAIPAMRKNRALSTQVLALFIPYVICDYLNVTYFTRTSLLIPAIAMLVFRKGGMDNEIEEVS